MFLFIFTSVHSIAQDMPDDITINNRPIYNLDIEKINPEHRAMSFYKILKNILNNPQEKKYQLSI